MSSSKPASSPVVSAPVAHPANPAKFAETQVFRVLKANPKRGASAKRYDAYGKVGETFTLGAYLDACAKLQPEEPRHRWRADITWDLKRGFIEAVEAPKA